MISSFSDNQNKFVIPDAPKGRSGIRFGFFRYKNQIGFRINFLSPRGEEKVLRNDTIFKCEERRNK
jgi:hypothetical protein